MANFNARWRGRVNALIKPLSSLYFSEGDRYPSQALLVNGETLAERLVIRLRRMEERYSNKPAPDLQGEDCSWREKNAVKDSRMQLDGEECIWRRKIRHF